MNFKVSVHAILTTFVMFSCFAVDSTYQNIIYSPEGIQTITKTIFRKGVNDQNKSDQFFFIEGLTRFCKEKGIQEGAIIGQQANDFIEEAFVTNQLSLSNPRFPIFGAVVKHVDKMGKRSVVMSRAMKKFVNKMIEKGKSVNQDQTANY